MSLSTLEKDEDLIADLRSGDKDRINTATKKLYDKTFWRVQRIIRIGGGVEENAKMILDDALIDLLQKVNSIQFNSKKGELTTLLFVIAKHKWLDELKRRYRNSQHQESLREHHLNHGKESVPSIEQIITAEESRKQIIAALEKLDAPCLHLLRMKYLEGISLRVIAERLGQKENTIRQQHKRCKEKIKRILGRDPRL